MHCQKASELLSERLDSPLSEEEVRALDSHLTGCAVCAAEERDMQIVSRLIEDVGHVEPPPMFAGRVMTRVRRHKRRMTALRFGLFALLAVVVCLAACVTPLLIPGQPISRVVARPSLVSALAGVTARVLDLLRTLAGAGRLIARAFVSGPGLASLIGMVVVAIIVVPVWARTVTRVAKRIADRTS